MAQVQSKDGTTIDYEQTGQGPAVILVAAALSRRGEVAKLAGLLAAHYTVINYDRRGRGQSGDTAPYAVEREIEDIEALIDKVGGTAALFGSSSGAILALEAACRLGGKVSRALLFEPPLIIDSSRPPMPADFKQQIEARLAAGKRGAAVKHFFGKGMGIPGPFVLLMSLLDPHWKDGLALAHTLPYDISLCAAYQTGQPLPAGRWAGLDAPVLLLTGEKSEAFFHSGAAALAGALAKGTHRVLPGAHHGSVVMEPETVAPAMLAFLAG